MPRKIQKETLQHKQAFEHYYGMGDTRSLKTVSEKMKVSHIAGKRWATDFNWKDRILHRDSINAKKLAKKTDNAIVKDKENYVKMIKAMTGQAVRDIRSEKLRVENVQDFERLIRLHLLLAGEPTEINALKVEVVHHIVGYIVDTVQKYVDDPQVITAIASDLRDFDVNRVMDAEVVE